jgi:hypothetical protein
MPYSISWHGNCPILYIQLNGAISLDELQALYYDVVAHLDGEDHVFVMVNQEQAEAFPQQITDIVNIVGQEDLPQIAWVILVGQMYSMLHFVGDAVFSQLNYEFRRFPTLDEAIEFLLLIEPEMSECFE